MSLLRRLLVPRPLRSLKHLLGVTLGKRIAQRPYETLFIPLLLSFILLAPQGMAPFTDPNTDIWHLFVPAHARAFQEQTAVQKAFPAADHDRYVPGAEADTQGVTTVIVVPKGNHSVMQDWVWNEVDALDTYLSSMGYAEACLGGKGNCYRHDFLDELKPFLKLLRLPEPESYQRLEYPVARNPSTGSEYFFGLHFGGVMLRNDSSLMGARAVRLIYPGDLSTEASRNRTLEFEKNLEEAVKDFSSEVIDVYVSTSLSLEKEVSINIQGALGQIGTAVALVLPFTLFVFFVGSRARPILAIFSSVVVVLAIASGFKVARLFYYDWQDVNLAAIYLLLGVGLDDAFVILAAWKRTRETHSAAERLEATFKESATSITLTTLTNLVSFLVGFATATFPCVELFCLFSALGIIFVYLWTLTLFGAALVLSHRFEETFEGVLDRYGTCHSVPSVNWTKISDKVYSTLLKLRYVILLAYAVCLGLAIYSFSTSFMSGLKLKNLARTDSGLYNFFKVEDEYFKKEHPYRLQFVIDEPLNYTDPDVRAQFDDLLESLRNSSFISEYRSLDSVWLEALTTNVDSEFDTEQDLIKELNLVINDEDNTKSGAELNATVKLNATTVLKSRFFLQSADVGDDEVAFMNGVRKIVDASPLNVVVFNPYFMLFDQYASIKPSTGLSVGLCLVVMFCVSAVCLRNAVPSFVIVVTVMSILVCVAGAMSALRINLDVVTMICLIICVGFSVDFALHIVNHFWNCSSDDTAVNRMHETLSAYAVPIAESAISTILSVAPLMLIDSYILNNFSLMMMLVVGLGALHGLLVLPALLAVLFSLGEDFVVTGSGVEGSDVGMDGSYIHHPADKVGHVTSPAKDAAAALKQEPPSPSSPASLELFSSALELSTIGHQNAAFVSDDDETIANVDLVSEGSDNDAGPAPSTPTTPFRKVFKSLRGTPVAGNKSFTL